MDSVLPCHDVLEGRAFAGLDGVSSRLVGWRSLSFQVKDELWRLLFWPVGHVRMGRNKRELPTILEDVDVDVGERIGTLMEVADTTIQLFGSFRCQETFAVFGMYLFNGRGACREGA